MDMTLPRGPRSLSLLFLMMSVALAIGTTGAWAEEQDRDEGHHTNNLMLFLGNTHDGDENGFTVGIDYERRITPRIGVGAIFDYASGDFRTTVLAAAASYRAVAGLTFLGAVGVDHHDNHNDALYRLGVLYHFEIGERWFVSPAVQVDFVNGETLTLAGVYLGWGF
jgi:hypothetical protein